MNLGLSDILTMQQVERPDSGNDRKVDIRPDSAAAGERKFKDYLHKVEQPEAQVTPSGPVTDQTQNVYTNNKTTGNLAVGNSTTDTNEDQLVASSAIDKIKGFIEGSFGQVVDNSGPGNLVLDPQANFSQVGLVEGNKGVLETIVANQETIGVVGQGDITSQLGQAVSGAFEEIAGVALKSRNIDTSKYLTDNVTITNIGQDSAAEVSISDVVDAVAILSAQKTAGKIDDVPTITDVAGKVIEIAKENAQTPEVVKADVKSSQVSSLLQGDKNVSKGLNLNNDDQLNNASKVNLVDKVVGANEKEPVKVATKQILDDLASAKGNNSKLVQNASASVSNNTKANINALKQSTNSTSFSKDVDLSLQANSKIDSDIPAHNFVKFQKHINAVENIVNNTAASRTADAQNVMTQIKFGVSMAAKGQRNISIQLHPKELGSVDVRMELGIDGKTRVAVMAEKVETLNLLQKESGSLKGMLQDALQTDSSHLSFSFHNKDDDQWKQFINESFGNGLSEQEDIADADDFNNGYQYQHNLLATEGLDIRV